MLKIYWETLKICLFGQTTRQPLRNFEPWKFWKYKQLGGLGPNPSCLSEKVYWEFLKKKWYASRTVIPNFVNNILKKFKKLDQCGFFFKSCPTPGKKNPLNRLTRFQFFLSSVIWHLKIKCVFAMSSNRVKLISCA